MGGTLKAEKNQQNITFVSFPELTNESSIRINYLFKGFLPLLLSAVCTNHKIIHY